MICPSCKREHKDLDNCEHCGFNVKSFREYAANKKSQQTPNSTLSSKESTTNTGTRSVGSYDSNSIDQVLSKARQKDKKKNSSKLVLIVIPVLALAGAYFVLSSNSPVESEVQSTQVNIQVPAKPTSVVAKNDSKKEKVAPKNTLYGVGQRIDESHHARNSIEAARNATVFINTTWGTLGSGFIVDQDCSVITNRHVIEEPLQQSEEFKQRVKEKSAQLKSDFDRLNRELNRAANNGYQREAAEKQDEINRLRAQAGLISNSVYKEMLEEKRSSQSNFIDNVFVDLTVSLVNGEKYKVTTAEVSGKYDLAKLSLRDDGCPFLKRGGSNDIIQGERVYTIGSPSGLAYTVTSGIFSGYREQEEKRFLQTDAPINPGNSGGPLITEDGKIIGVNTAILAGTEGIGFAIPISIVESEFSLY